MQHIFRIIHEKVTTSDDIIITIFYDLHTKNSSRKQQKVPLLMDRDELKWVWRINVKYNL